jgi:hypothetical protein
MALNHAIQKATISIYFKHYYVSYCTTPPPPASLFLPYLQQPTPPALHRRSNRATSIPEDGRRHRPPNSPQTLTSTLGRPLPPPLNLTPRQGGIRPGWGRTVVRGNGRAIEFSIQKGRLKKIKQQKINFTCISAFLSITHQNYRE